MTPLDRLPQAPGGSMNVGDHVTWVNAYGDQDDWSHAVIRELVTDARGQTVVVSESVRPPGLVLRFYRTQRGRWRGSRFWLVPGWV